MKLTSRSTVLLIISWCFSGASSAADFSAVDDALKQGQVDTAEQQLSAVAENGPPAKIEKYRAQIALERQDFKLAVKHAEQAAELEPNADHLAFLGDCYGLKAQNGKGLGRLGSAKKAKGAWERAIAQDPSHVPAHQSLIQYHLQAPGIAGGRKDEARSLAKKLVVLDPERGLQAQFQVAAATEANDEAMQLAKQLSSSYPEQPQYGLQLAIVYQNTEQFDAARTTLADNLSRHPEHWGSLYQVGRTAALSGQALPEGRQALEQFIADSGENDEWQAAAHWRLAQVHQHGDDRALAIEAVDRALLLRPKHKQAKKLARELKKNR